MRLLLFLILLSFFSACTQKKWDKDTVVNDCLGDFTKRNEKEKIFTTMQLALVCDCIGEKMIQKYKSGKEADADEKGAEQMGRDCALEVMDKK